MRKPIKPRSVEEQKKRQQQRKQRRQKSLARQLTQKLEAAQVATTNRLVRLARNEAGAMMEEALELFDLVARKQLPPQTKLEDWMRRINGFLYHLCGPVGFDHVISFHVQCKDCNSGSTACTVLSYAETDERLQHYLKNAIAAVCEPPSAAVNTITRKDARPS